MLDLVSIRPCEHSLLCILNAGLPGLLGSTDGFKLYSTSGLGFFSLLSVGQGEQKSLAESGIWGAASQVKRLIIGMF